MPRFIPLTPEQVQARFDLYKFGWNDYEIGRALGVHNCTIHSWRKKHGLPTSVGIKDNRRALYESGMSDPAIARQLGLPSYVIRDWRIWHKLPRHPAKRLPLIGVAEEAFRTLLYELGWSDGQIARDRAVRFGVITTWRERRGLPKQQVDKKAAGEPLSIAALIPNVRQAIGRHLPSDIAESAVSDMLMALCEGKIHAREIKARGKSFGNHAFAELANRYGPKSLDQKLGDDDGFTLLDTLKDESQSSWLEEMGTTVW